MTASPEDLARHRAAVLELLRRSGPLPISEIRLGLAPGVTSANADRAVAWAFECNGFNLYRISEWASEGELLTFFGRCMGYDL